jgi:lipoprotein NlpD
LKQDQPRLSIGVTQGIAGVTGRFFTLLAIVMPLWGCTASWRAPVETRGPQPVEPRSVAIPRAKPERSMPVTQTPPAYRVRNGDTLFGIAWDHGLDYRVVAGWNDIRPPYRIYVGQSLRLRPPTAARQPLPKKVSRAPAPKSTRAPEARRPAAKPAVKPAPKKPPVSSQRLAWRWPVGGKVSSTFKPSDPLRKGIKIAGREGSEINAAEGGRVVYSGSGLIGYGRLIIIKHNDNYLSAYGHNRELLVDEGDQVAKGQKIASMGRASDGVPLLHFEIRRDGKPVDPLRLLPKR